MTAIELVRKILDAIQSNEYRDARIVINTEGRGYSNVTLVSHAELGYGIGDNPEKVIIIDMEE
jgi:hypothetical protein